MRSRWTMTIRTMSEVGGKAVMKHLILLRPPFPFVSLSALVVPLLAISPCGKSRYSAEDATARK